MTLRLRILIVTLITAGLLSSALQAQHPSHEHDSSEVHEITLLLMPTMYPLDWTSPSSLYKSMLHIYMKTLGLKDNYLLGHVAVRLNSPLLEEPLYTAQSSKKWQERIDMVLKQRVGFGILGAALEGRVEPVEEIKHKVEVYKQRNKLAFITYRIQRGVMERILTFFKAYQDKMHNDLSPSDFYGGAFWPRYHYEGAGCSAFAFTMLDLGKLIPPEAEEWKVDVKIPMNIIGGKFNNGKKIKNRTIKRTTSWYAGNGSKNTDYVEYYVYDPSIMFDWIIAQHSNPDAGYDLVHEGIAPGLYKDARNIEFDPEEPIFMQRPDTNLFINHYYKRINLEKM